MDLEKAWKQYEIARHLLFKTYPLTKDQKVLVGVVHSLFSAVQSAMDIALRTHNIKRTTFPAKLAAFAKIIEENSYNSFILELRELSELQKKCPIEFPRGDKYVICDEKYHLRTITAKDLQEYLRKTETVLQVLSTNRK